jgi:hypothetical protein
MYYLRPELRLQRVLSADQLRGRRDGEFVRTAGCIIARQRPGTAKGFIFLSMEDESGIANASLRLICMNVNGSWLPARSFFWSKEFFRIKTV